MRRYNIPVFVSHQGCPFECVFCNQRHITGKSNEVHADDVRRIIKEHLKTLPETDRYVETAFFGGSFTGIEPERQRELLEPAYEYLKKGSIDGIRLSTRPDYISDEILDLLSEYGVTTIELGVQSLDNEVLKSSGRGHTAEQVEKAVRCIRKYNFSLGLQMMTGLPGDTPEKSIETAGKIIGLKPDFVRIYPTLVVRDTKLEEMYKMGIYKSQSLDEAVKLCCELKKLFDKAKINIIRISLVTTDEISPGGSLVAGPFHSSFGELVSSALYMEKLSDIIENDKSSRKEYVFSVNPREISKAVGNKRQNINKCFEKYGVKIKFKADSNVDEGEIKEG